MKRRAVKRSTKLRNSLYLLCSYIQMAPSNGGVLVSKEVREELHDDSDSISELVRIQKVICLIVLILMPKYAGLIPVTAVVILMTVR
jgi:hypothetical protein